MSVYITGDTHGDFSQTLDFCTAMEVKRKDIMVVLGDAALNYCGNMRDVDRKNSVMNSKPTWFFIHGNHEMRPTDVQGYQLMDWHGGKVWIQPEFPRLVFAKDGEIYDLGGKKVIVLGGAYSVDKEYRLRMGYRWFANEQPSDEIKAYAEEQLKKIGWKVDIVFSHTCPRKYEPVECFMSGVDQSKVDKSTENWLDTIEDRLDYKKWYCGHWHINKRIDKMEFLFHDVRLL